MDSIYLIISQNGAAIRILIIFLIIILLYWFQKVKRKAYKINSSDKYIPAHLWFYSQLVNFEIGVYKANSTNLFNYFVRFLYRKYKISKYDLKIKSLFDIVKDREDNRNLLDLYGEIWNSIEDLKHSSTNEVIEYIKSIKYLFNKEDVTEWIELRKNEKKCNDC